MIFLGVDWGKIFSVPFWLDIDPGGLSSNFEKFFLIVLAVCYLFYLLSKLFQKQLNQARSYIKAKFWQSVASFCLTMAITFTFIFFFRYEAIPILGGRFWMFLWVIMGVVWLVLLLKTYFIVIPKKEKELEVKNNFNKYLTNPKKKKK